MKENTTFFFPPPKENTTFFSPNLTSLLVKYAF